MSNLNMIKPLDLMFFFKVTWSCYMTRIVKTQGLENSSPYGMALTLLNVCQKQRLMSWYITMEFPWVNPEMGFTLNDIMLRVILHMCFVNIVTYFSVLLLPFSLIYAYCLSCMVLDLQMLTSFLPYVDFSDGASHSTWNLASVACAIYMPIDELISLHGICLRCATNDITEYSAIIELLSEAISLVLDAQFYKLTLNLWYCS